MRRTFLLVFAERHNEAIRVLRHHAGWFPFCAPTTWGGGGCQMARPLSNILGCESSDSRCFTLVTEDLGPLHRRVIQHGWNADWTGIEQSSHWHTPSTREQDVVDFRNAGSAAFAYALSDLKNVLGFNAFGSSLMWEHPHRAEVLAGFVADGGIIQWDGGLIGDVAGTVVPPWAGTRKLESKVVMNKIFSRPLPLP